MGLRDREMAATTSALFERLVGGGGFEALHRMDGLQWCDAVVVNERRKFVPGVLAVYGLGLVWATRKHLAKHPGVWGPNDFFIATDTIASAEVSPPMPTNYALGNLRRVRVHPGGGNWINVTTKDGASLRFSQLSDHLGMSVAFTLDSLMASVG